ncbi:MAG: hypothetical protein CBD18_05355 [Opitutales bacterium TMED158]|nr:MAG: hypothetical protein CBD18_05355 [Opitutales bacterium TMED158]
MKIDDPTNKNIYAKEFQPYQICNYCIMDTSDPEIEFDSDGNCRHCKPYRSRTSENASAIAERIKNQKRAAELESIVDKIKKAGRGKKYDCIIGVSGGVDSSYVAWLVKDLGLRPLAIHLDNGWNSELAVQNIHRLLEKLGIELYTHVLNWDEFRDLQLAFLKSSTADSEIPTDHALVALHYDVARKFGIKWFVTGSNTQTESIMPRYWSQGHADWTYIKGLHSLFGTKRLTNYPHYSWPKLAYHTHVKRIQRFDILHYVDYRKTEVVEFLKGEMGWVPYPTKHGESIYTKFYQQYILPRKFNADKRRAHLSNLVVNGEITRDEALGQLESSTPPERELQNDRAFVIKKLEIDEAEFESIMNAPPKTIYDYPNDSFSPLHQKIMARFYQRFA